MEEMVQRQRYDGQDTLVRQYCREAEGLVTLAGSRADAMKIKEEWCNRFRQECESELLINATSAYLDEIIMRQWNENPA